MIWGGLGERRTAWDGALCLHGIDGRADRFDEDLVLSRYWPFQVVDDLPGRAGGFDNNSFHDRCVVDIAAEAGLI